MITELAIALGTTYVYRKTKNVIINKEANELEGKWKAIMIASGAKNKNEETYDLLQIIPTQYGFECSIIIPFGLSFNDLNKLLPIIETNLNSICLLEKDRLETYATLKIINTILDFEYSPVKTKSNEIYLGKRLDETDLILNLNTNPQILISGQTGTGKSFLFASILTNLIYYNSKDIDIYLFQIMKGEIDIFRNCPSVKFTSDNQEEILVMLKKISNVIHKRSKQFSELGIKNISHWNNHFPNKKMKRIIIGIEEISFFMNAENDHFEYFLQIIKAGRSAGVHFIGLTQRTTSANLGGNGELKSQVTVITAKQRSELDSRNAIDVNNAAYLGKQEFIALTSQGYITFKAPTIDEDFKILNKYVPEIIIPNNTKSEIPKEKSSIHGGWHIPTKDEWEKVKDDIPEFTYVKEQQIIPPGQMEAPKTTGNKIKNGVISIKEVLKNAK